MSAIPSWAVRGAKVVCISDVHWRLDDANPSDFPITGITYPVARCEYTIEAVEAEGDDWWLMLVECGDDDIFNGRCFRPVSKRTTEQDIAEHFSHLLTVDAPEGVDA
jgi:hypothetical protein